MNNLMNRQMKRLRKDWI